MCRYIYRKLPTNMHITFSFHLFFSFAFIFFLIWFIECLPLSPWHLMQWFWHFFWNSVHFGIIQQEGSSREGWGWGWEWLDERALLWSPCLDCVRYNANTFLGGMSSDTDGELTKLLTSTVVLLHANFSFNFECDIYIMYLSMWHPWGPYIYIMALNLVMWSLSNQFRIGRISNNFLAFHV